MVTSSIAALFVGTTFVALFLLTAQVDRPSDLPVAVVGTPSQMSASRSALESGNTGVIAVVPSASKAEARAAVERRAVYGAYVASEGRLLFASANGPAVANMLQTVFGPVAEQAGEHLETEDLVAASEADLRGTAVFYTAFGIVLAAYLFGIAQSQTAPLMSLPRRVLALVGFSLVSGTAAGLIAGTSGFGSVPGEQATLILVLVLLAAAVGSATLAMMRLGGPVGPLLASAVLLVLGNATSGGVVPAEYLPAALQPLSHVLPVGIAVEAMIGSAYFGGDGVLPGIVLLSVWTAGGILTLVVLARRRRSPGSSGRHPARRTPLTIDDHH